MEISTGTVTEYVQFLPGLLHVNIVRVYDILVHESNQEAPEGVLIGSGMQPTNHISDLHIIM